MTAEPRIAPKPSRQRSHGGYIAEMRSFILALSLIAIAAPASAQAPKRGNADLQTYCAGDAVTFCAGIDPNSPQMDACFKANMSKLSENCRRAIDAYKGGGGK